MERIQLWSCGGGRQSAGMAALMVEGRLKLPEHACMVALEWEVKTTWAYVNTYIRPAMKNLGVPFTLIPRKKYANRDLWAGADGKSSLLPMYSDQSGKSSKLPEWCSAEWKREVVLKWAVEQGWKSQGVDTWFGISWDERSRRRPAKRQWMQPVYPLLDWFPKSMGVSACIAAVERVGWPEPPRSRCHMCPNQSDDEWSELTPAEFNLACEMEDEVRAIDQHGYFHRSMVPLRDVIFKPTGDRSLYSGGCSAGMCN